MRKFKALRAVGLYISAVAIPYTIQNGFLGVIGTEGISMEPTITPGAYLLVYKPRDCVISQLKKGDVIICRSPDKPTELLCKRIAALDGDKIAEMHPFSYFQRSSNYVPRGHMWLLGDNASVSADSRQYGPVPIALTQGRVLCQIYPTFKKI